jgi:hypothetical protein
LKFFLLNYTLEYLIEAIKVCLKILTKKKENKGKRGINKMARKKLLLARNNWSECN